MNIAILWTHLSGYLNACIKELASREGVRIFVSNIAVSGAAPYEESQFSWIQERYQWEGKLDGMKLLERLETFEPDLILACGWHIPGYRHVCRQYSGRAVRILTTDQSWRFSPKKMIGILVSKYYIHPLCEALFVGGERQAAYAKMLGFRQSQIMRGVFSCDHERFSAVHFERRKKDIDPKSFVFIGRYSREKGLDVLVEAYRLYRQMTPDPWPLKCYGAGPIEELLEEAEGIERNGFCQPDELPEKLLDASCLVLPSLYEPWALVVHEAVSAGMAVICTDAVGASVHLVQDGYNGYIVDPGDAAGLAEAMHGYSILPESKRREMGDNGYSMSLQFTPKRWANIIISRSHDLTDFKRIR